MDTTSLFGYGAGLQYEAGAIVYVIICLIVISVLIWKTSK